MIIKIITANFYYSQTFNLNTVLLLTRLHGGVGGKDGRQLNIQLIVVSNLAWPDIMHPQFQMQLYPTKKFAMKLK